MLKGSCYSCGSFILGQTVVRVRITIAQATKGSFNSSLRNSGRLVAMASQSRTLPVLVATACCVAVLRSFWAPSQPTFLATQQSVHMGCQALSAGALASGNVPAIVNTVPARPGVPAHFKVTLETPDGTQSFASCQHWAPLITYVMWHFGTRRWSRC